MAAAPPPPPTVPSWPSSRHNTIRRTVDSKQQAATSSSSPSSSSQQISPSLEDNGRRRSLLLSCCLVATAAAILPAVRPAKAFTFGISGPKDWLREQKKKAANFVLAPIDASRVSLRRAHDLVTNSTKGDEERETVLATMEEVRSLAIGAARDCVPQDRNAFVSFQSNTGVEVCTFRLIVNNAASLLQDKDPVKVEAEALLGELIRSFGLLADALGSSNAYSSREQLENNLQDTMVALDKFEQGIRDCLEV